MKALTKKMGAGEKAKILNKIFCDILEATRVLYPNGSEIYSEVRAL